MRKKKDRRTGEAESLRNGKIGKSYFRESKKMEREKEMEEISYRRAVRDLYPLGLKIINFNDKLDYKRFLPLYYFVDEKNDKFVLDLQVMILLKDIDLLSKDNQPTSEKIPVDPRT